MTKNKKSEGGNGLVSDVFVTESNDWFGDDGDDDAEYYEEGEIASCIDVLGFCFKRSFKSWISLVVHCTLFTVLVYCYFYGIVLLGNAVEVISGCQVGSLLEMTSNPLTCVLLGVIATCICQSSTAVIFVIGSLVGNVLTIRQGIYMAMGANVGNTVANSLIVLVHSLNKSELERAVAGASVNDFYYFYALLIFLPLEACTGLLYHLSATLVPDSLSGGYLWSGFMGNLIVPYTDFIIIPNKVCRLKMLIFV
jgi:sodium-dependent phosphate cotransporter